MIGSGEVKSYKDVSAGTGLLEVCKVFVLQKCGCALFFQQVVDAYVEGVARKKGTSGWSTQRGTFSQEAWRAIKGGEGREGAHAMLKLAVHKNLPVRALHVTFHLSLCGRAATKHWIGHGFSTDGRSAGASALVVWNVTCEKCLMKSI